MGMTFTTLHLYGVEKNAVESLLSPGDLLREQNAPWLSVVPAHDPCHGENLRMETLAKRLTKADGEAAALLFSYYDDDCFRCGFYRAGRKSAGCDSGGNWAKLGKQLNILFGEEAPGKALRYGSRCSDLREQVRLLEETSGAALYDIPEEEPRRVLRSDGVLREIKAREAALRKRPKQFVLTELDREEWPENVRMRQDLFERLYPHWREYNLSNLLYPFYNDYGIPACPCILAYSYQEARTHRDLLLLFESASGRITEQKLPEEAKLGKVLWRTPEGEPVVHFLPVYREVTSAGQSRRFEPGFVSCLRADGSERWRFDPELIEYEQLTHAHTSVDGIITFYTPWGKCRDGRYGARLWRIDGKTGEVLCSRQLPETEELRRLIYVEEPGVFVYPSSTTNELVLLNGALEEQGRWGGYSGNGYMPENCVCGSILWDSNFYLNSRAISLYDLRDGACRNLLLEIPAIVNALLPDGRILGTNEKGSILTVFDPEGRVTARCTIPGALTRVFVEEDRVCLEETRGPDTHGFLSDALFDETSRHVWRLDPAPGERLRP